MSLPELEALAREHWTEWLPDKVKALKAAGTLNEEIHAAASLAQAEIEVLLKQGYQEHEAREVALPMFILLKPEPGARIPEYQQKELDELEREYQKNSPVLADEDNELEFDDGSAAP